MDEMIPPPLGDRGRDKHRMVPVAFEFARAADANHHLRATPMHRIHVAVTVRFQRRVDVDQARLADHGGIFGQFAGAQDDFGPEEIPVVVDLLQFLLRQGECGGAGGGQAARPHQVDAASKISVSMLKVGTTVV